MGRLVQVLLHLIGNFIVVAIRFDVPPSISQQALLSGPIGLSRQVRYLLELLIISKLANIRLRSISEPEHRNRRRLPRHLLRYLFLPLRRHKAASLFNNFHLHPLLLLEQLQICPKIGPREDGVIVDFKAVGVGRGLHVVTFALRLVIWQELTLLHDFVVYCFYALLY
jgi:hypothetical protein